MSLFQQAIRPPLGCRANRKSPLELRLYSKMQMKEGTSCVFWTGHITRNGYGQAGHRGRVHYAHRLVYETFVGPIPPGLHIDHICKRRSCVNPAHLEPVTQAENNRRSPRGSRRATAS
jgi:hypothetical protein